MTAIDDAQPGQQPQAGNPSPRPALVEGRLARAIGRFFLHPDPQGPRLWRMGALNALFAILALALLASLVALVWQDHDRQWRRFAAGWRSQAQRRLQEDLAAEAERLRRESLPALEVELAALDERMGRDPGLVSAEEEARKSSAAASLAEQKAREARSVLEARRFHLEEARRRALQDPRLGAEGLADLERDFEESCARPAEALQRSAGALASKAAEAKDRALSLSKERDDLKARIARLTRARGELERRLDAIRSSALNALKDAPLIPPFDPTARIQKVVLADLPQDLHFVRVPRVDRCKTCHLNIDDPDPSLAAFSDGKSLHGGRLWRSHPRLDLFVGAASPHPYSTFGCTICHLGDGRATEFVRAAHTPRDGIQKRLWRERYGWHEAVHEESPMLPLPQVSAACARCHPDEERIEGADRWNEGRSLVDRLGCNGCHRIRGLEPRRRAGPDLTWIAAKTRPGFIPRWLRDPSAFRSATGMPRFFGLSNGRGTVLAVDRNGRVAEVDLGLRGEAEVLALSAYLEGLPPAAASPAPAEIAGGGDPAKGRELVRRTGCLGCHSIAREGFLENTFAPDLGSLGSKVRREWLMAWIADPRRHDPLARMPRLRIEKDADGPAKIAAMADYLLSLRDPAFEAVPVPQADSLRREAVLEILASLMRPSTPAAAAELENLPAESLLQRAGARIFLHRGCAGCHGVPGGGEFQPIGPELTREGMKPVDQLDFARWGIQEDGEPAIERSRTAWIRTKLTDPRIFDTVPARIRQAGGPGIPESSGVMLKKPLETFLRMPLFSFRQRPGEALAETREEGIEAVVTCILGLQDPSPKIHRLDPGAAAVDEGRRLIRFLNCQGCHRIGLEPRSVRIEDLCRKGPENGPDEPLFPDALEKETWLASSLRIGRVTVPRGSWISTLLKDENDPNAQETVSILGAARSAWDTAGTPEPQRRLRVLGYNEGRVRRYFGASSQDRPKAPPVLRQEGERVRGDWLYGFLLDVRTIRPWLEIRMPAFALSNHEAEVLTRWFKLTASGPYPPLGLSADQLHLLARWFPLPSQVPYPPMDLSRDAEAALEDWLRVRGAPPYPQESIPELSGDDASLRLAALGREMFQVSFPGDPLAARRLQCNTCHGAGEEAPKTQDPNSWGPDFARVRDRLRPAWIGRWLLDPRSYIPDTRMPNHFTTFGDPFDPLQVQRPGFPGEIEALIRFLLHLRES